MLPGLQLSLRRLVNAGALFAGVAATDRGGDTCDAVFIIGGRFDDVEVRECLTVEEAWSQVGLEGPPLTEVGRSGLCSRMFQMLERRVGLARGWIQEGKSFVEGSSGCESWLDTLLFVKQVWPSAMVSAAFSATAVRGYVQTAAGGRSGDCVAQAKDSVEAWCRMWEEDLLWPTYGVEPSVGFLPGTG